MNTFEIGERIRDLRKKHRMTQAEVARKIGVSSPTITQWENNQTSIKLATSSRFQLVFV